MINFILGIIAGIACYGIYQDSLGMDRYIEWCQESWKPAADTLPGHIVTVLICVIIIAVRIRK